jgi:hypothetical protein
MPRSRLFAFKWTSHSETLTKRPRSLVLWLLLILGVVVAVAGAVGLWNALDATFRGIPTTARVIEHEHRGGARLSTYAQVEITSPGGRTFRTEVFDQLGVADWVDGGTVNLICVKLPPDNPHCQLASARDRWLMPVVLLVAGLAVVWWWWFWWRRRLNT